MDPGLITVTLSSSEFGGFPGLPPDLLPPEGLMAPRRRRDARKWREKGDGDGGEIPPDFQLPEGFPGLDALGIPENVEPPEPVEVELTIEGFIVTGSRDAAVMIKGEEMGEGDDAADGR